MSEELRTDITKEEAVRRQLETAIALFFSNDDAISIHVLAQSAGRILTDICKHKKVTSFRDLLMDYIKPEYQQQFSNLLNAAYNYFKHADKDPFTELERFNPETNEVLLFACCYDYWHCYGSLSPLAVAVYFSWYLGAHPQMIKDGFPHGDLIKGAFDKLDLKPKSEQLRIGKTLLKAFFENQNQKLPISGWDETKNPPLHPYDWPN